MVAPGLATAVVVVLPAPKATLLSRLADAPLPSATALMPPAKLLEPTAMASLPLANAFGYNLDNSSVVREIRKLLVIKPSTLHLIAILLAVYAAIELCEAVGLWLLKRWGEYFAAVATAIFLPYEVHDIINKVTAFRVIFFVINVAAVVYLLWTKRLFGIGGGRAAYEAKRHEESLLEVEEAARPEAEVG